MWFSHGYFHPILELKFYSLECSIWLHTLIRMVTIVVSGYMGRQPPSKKLFCTTCTKVVYCKTFLLSVIIRPQIYPLLVVTLPFKERYILHHHFCINHVRTYLRLVPTKAIVYSIIAFKWKIYRQWTCCWRNRLFHIPSFSKQSGCRRHMIHSGKWKHPTVIRGVIIRWYTPI